MQCFQAFVATFLLISASYDVRCYENAYDLAEQRMFQRRTDAFGQPGYFSRDERRSHLRQPFGTRLRRPEYPNEPIFGRHVGNGYDNLGNAGLSRQGDWAEFLEPSRTSFTTPKWNHWNRYSDDSNARSRFYEEEIPFHRKDSSGFLSRADSHFDRRDFDVEEPFGEKHLERRTFLQKDGVGHVKTRPSNIFSETPLRRPFLSRRTDDLPIHPRPRVPLPHTRTALRQQPAFYRKDFFGRRNSPHEAGGTSVEAEDVLEDVQTAAGAADDSVITEGGSYFSNNEDQEEKKSDAAYHNDKKGAVVDVANKQKVGEATRFDKNGGNKSTTRVNKTAKKGHTTKGFATHHHKDETGNTTTFFDESSDTGGQEDYQDHEDEFGARRTMEVLNGREDGQFFKELGGRIGRFGSGLLQDKTKVEKDAVAKSNRFKQEESFGKGKDKHDKRTKLETDYLGGGTWGESY